METETEQPILPVDGRFKSKAPGAKWQITPDRSLSAFPGEKDEIMLVYENGARRTCVRLSKEAAQTTIVALIRYVDGPPADDQAPQAA